MISSSNLFPRALLLIGMAALPFVGFALPEHEAPSAVYTLNNAVSGNRVLTFSRDDRGTLRLDGTYPTGGKGTGASLGDQGALALTEDGHWLLAVNAGSNELSVFSIHHDALVLTDIVPSGGMNPISVTIADNLVYVLNAGGAVGATDNISGFYLTKQGLLVAVPESTQPLSGANVAPAQVSFGLGGDVLIVTEKKTNRVDTFVVAEDGRAGPVISTPSSGATPFGFAVSSRGFVFVSEAVSSALSSYRLHADGSLQLVTPSLSNLQKAACWAVLSHNQKYAYTANAASNTISGYKVQSNGSVTLLDSTGFTAQTDDHPLDLATTGNGRFVYSLNTNSKTIVGFRMSEDGRLIRVSDIGGLPIGGSGLVAR